MAHHPEKFLDGRMLWRGRIYSPLPFVRSLWGTRINAGVWGTAAFPSVYRTDVHPFAFLPHSIRWQVISFVLTLAGARRRRDRAAPLGGGAAARQRAGRRSPSTIAKNIAYALRSDVDSLPGSKLWYRGDGRVSAFPPAARARARADPRRAVAARGGAAGRASAQTSRGPRPSLAEAWRALLLISGSVTEDRFWSETWTSADRVLAAAHRLAAAVARGAHDRDRRRLVRRSRRQRVRRPLGVARRPRARRGARRRQGAAARQHASAADQLRRRHARSVLGAALLVGARDRRRAALAAGRRDRRRRSPSRSSRSSSWRTAQTTAIVRRGIARVTVGSGMVRDAVGPGARAAGRAVAAAHVRPAQRLHLRRDDRGARRRHVHAARGGDRRR